MIVLGEKDESDYVDCPFDRRHRMPKSRLLYHFAICGAKKRCDARGHHYFACKYFMGHIFFQEEDLRKHEDECEYKVSIIAETRLVGGGGRTRKIHRT